VVGEEVDGTHSQDLAVLAGVLDLYTIVGLVDLDKIKIRLTEPQDKDMLEEMQEMKAGTGQEAGAVDILKKDFRRFMEETMLAMVVQA
jgi:hypothetical protein